MNISKFFIDRPIFAGVLSLLIVLVGAVAIFRLPVAEYPEVVPVSVVVHAQYPGANAKTVAETVAAPIEESVNGVENMLYMQSQANGDGHLYLTVTFRLGTDPDKAQQLVQNRVSQALPRLPEDVQRLGVTTTKSAPNITLAVQLTSSNGKYDVNYLSNYAILNVRDRLQRIQGVGQVRLWGPGGYAMRVWLDPQAVAQRSLTATEVVEAVRKQNIQVSAGAIGSSPAPKDTAMQFSVTAQGRLRTPEEFGNIVLKTSSDGGVVRLSHVARIELAAEDYGIRALLNNKAVLPIAIMEAPGANALDIEKNVRLTMEELKKNFPEGIEYGMTFNPTKAVRDSIDSVIHTLFEAIALVVLVVFLFLHTWRASIIPLLAVPVSIIGTFGCLLAMGFSVNTLSLFGMVLAIGIVVDDAIVVVENVERNIAAGLPAKEATYAAMREVSGPIIAIALTLSAVFIPLAFISGLTGQFYKQFAVTISVSTIISAINSLTLSPALAALLLKGEGARPDRLTRLMERVFGRYFHAFNRFFERGSNRYAGVVSSLLGRKAATMAIYAVLVGLTVLLTRTVPGGFVPIQDKSYLVMYGQLPAGASLDRTEAVARDMTRIALDTPGVSDVFIYPGLSLNGSTTSSSAAIGHVLLKPYAERKSGDLSADAIAAELNRRFGAIKEAAPVVFAAPPVMGLGTLGGFKLQLEDRASLGYDALDKARQDFLGKAAKAPELASLFSTYQIGFPQLAVNVDRVKAEQLGLAVADIYDTMQIYLGSLYVNDFNEFGRVYQVRVQADGSARASPEDILKLKARSRNGEMIPLAAVATITQGYGPELVVRYNGYTAADISGSPAPGYSSGQAKEAIERIAAETLPPGISYEWTDLSYQQIIAGNSGLIVFPICVLLVFLVLAAQYESLTLPLSVILIVPMSIFAALAGVWLTRGDNNIFTQIGLIVLVGLSSKNAILIVEFARHLELQGRSVVEAVVEACKLRLRPILMTSIAFIMGVVPLVLATGAGAEMRRAMGISVFFGMLGVTLFGLLLTPVFYVVVRRMSNRPLHAVVAPEAVHLPSAPRL
ncbi:efflux RND transporter permease subunit [Cupriavidus pauculus]|uniref:efflux RND transporter permease subunit n=1 Tax=Cupriavidus pauculus TaxID=82633 RepID=UPI001FD2D3DC|nr:multidrug efflux RND transporter permease subunit [Cupriavidus pauculus]